MFNQKYKENSVKAIIMHVDINMITIISSDTKSSIYFSERNKIRVTIVPK
jgi:hypothetical protein